MNHKEDCCCPCCQIPRLEKTIAEQTVQIAMLEKAVDTGVEAEEKLEAENKRLKEVLNESFKLQVHYAELLNMHDGGERIVFNSIEEFEIRVEQALAAPPQKGQDNV